MTTRLQNLALVLIFSALVLSACLGEEAFPGLETIPAATFAAPLVDPTIAALPRRNISSDVEQLVSNQFIQQIPHDLIGRNDCLMCHKHGVSNAPRIPDAHRGLENNTCQTCHTAPASTQLTGAEMYMRVCVRCHGENGAGGVGTALNTKAYLRSVTDDDIRAAILRGRGTAQMLAWGDLGLLTERQIDEIAAMIRAWETDAPETPGLAVAPVNAALGDPESGEALFAQFCTGCHGINGETATEDGFVLRQVVSSLEDETISVGVRDGGNGMPSFHALLTTEDVNDLLALMRSWQAGLIPTPTPIAISGEEVYARVCARCHGRDGQGGIAPPLNSKDFLTENDDEAIRQWVERGTLGTSMLSWGDLGLLTTNQIDELVVFIREWEPTAPATLDEAAEVKPPRAEAGEAAHGQQLYAQFCSGCHGLEGESRTGEIVVNSGEFLNNTNDEIVASQILNGGREMPSFHSILTRQDVNDLLAFMFSGFEVKTTTFVPSFSQDILPIFTEHCNLCHGTAGGWNAENYDAVMTSGDNRPAVVPGDPTASLLAEKMLGTQSQGTIMPPSGSLENKLIQVILDWIFGGAPDN